jgi:hypothetical protein
MGLNKRHLVGLSFLWSAEARKNAPAHSVGACHIPRIASARSSGCSELVSERSGGVVVGARAEQSSLGRVVVGVGADLLSLGGVERMNVVLSALRIGQT